MVASRPNVEVSLLACLACPTETELLDFVEGRLDGAPATTIEDHLDGCADCRTLVAHLVADPAGGRALRDDVSGSARLGRFVILGAVGAGGMGVVYAAYDPRLDRKVALKVLRPVIAEDEISGRVLREAQAMARLSHPNAVQVYEVGELGDRVFVAMELVEGGTLAEWLRKSPRSTAEIVAMFVQAGRGLEAAHAAGLVHRDFKPANVLVGTDGRARVTDFGLAHGAGGELGGAVGTPGYVAPEQQAGGVVDARADQYAFSVALSRALGEAPAWLKRVLERGEAARPEDRFATMGDLLDALGRDPWVIRRRLAVAGAIAALLVFTAVGVHRASVRQARVCEASAGAFAGIWDPSVKDAVHQAFRSTGAPFAESAWTGVSRSLDAYVADWIAMSKDSCEATRVRGEQSDAMLDLRTACLRARREEVKAESDVFRAAAADRGVVEKAVQAVSQLTPLDRCADRDWLAAKLKPPAKEADRRTAEEIRSQLVQAKALMDAGLFARGLGIATDALERARALAYPPVVAEAQLLCGKLEFRNGDFAAAERMFLDAALSAEGAGDDDEVAPAFVGEAESLNRIGRYQDALERCRIAEAAVVRLGSPLELSADLESLVGRTDMTLGRLDDAMAHFQDELALRKKAHPASLLPIARSLKDLGELYHQQGKLDLARETLASSLSMRESVLGPSHPDVATLLTSVGSVYLDQGDLAGADALLRRAVAIRETSLGPDHPDLATSLCGRGAVLEKEGRPAEALADFRRAFEIRARALGPTHPDTLASGRDVGRLSPKN
ncbi:MAG: protein kinase domain-containing protein [Polyangiaceae bacterium]